MHDFKTDNKKEAPHLFQNPLQAPGWDVSVNVFKDIFHSKPCLPMNRIVAS